MLPPATSALLHNTSTVLLGMDCMTKVSRNLLSRRNNLKQ